MAQPRYWGSADTGTKERPSGDVHREIRSRKGDLAQRGSPRFFVRGNTVDTPLGPISRDVGAMAYLYLMLFHVGVHTLSAKRLSVEMAHPVVSNTLVNRSAVACAFSVLSATRDARRVLQTLILLRHRCLSRALTSG